MSPPSWFSMYFVLPAQSTHVQILSVGGFSGFFCRFLLFQCLLHHLFAPFGHTHAKKEDVLSDQEV